MTDCEAMKMALAGLKQSIGLHIRNDEELEPIIEYLEAALAQPEQEPAPVGMTCKVWTHGCALFDGIDLPNETLLYTAPPSKQDVNQELIAVLEDVVCILDSVLMATGEPNPDGPSGRAKKLIAKHKEQE